jgi:hypothetical protein
MEPTEDDTALIESLTLIALNGTILDVIDSSGAVTLNRDELPLFTIIADAPNADRVIFNVDGRRIVENVSPFTIAGNIGTDYEPWDVPAGTYNIIITPYTRLSFRNYIPGPVVSLTVIIIESTDQPSQGPSQSPSSAPSQLITNLSGQANSIPIITTLKLVGIRNGSDLQENLDTSIPLEWNTTAFPRFARTIHAEASNVGSVRFIISKISQGSLVEETANTVDNEEPWQLLGGGKPWRPDPGNYEVLVTPFGGVDATGVEGSTVSLEVIVI